MNWMPGFRDELEKIAEDAKVEEALSKSVSNLEELHQVLEPGDILFTAPLRSKMRSFFGKHIFKPLSRTVQGTDYGHASIYLGEGKVMETRIGEGTRQRTLEAVLKKNNVVAFRPQVPDHEKDEAVEYAKSQEGVPYAKTHLLASALPMRPSKTWGEHADVEKHICSTLVANAYKKQDFVPTSSFYTRPAELLRSHILRPLTALRREEK